MRSLRGTRARSRARCVKERDCVHVCVCVCVWSHHLSSHPTPIANEGCVFVRATHTHTHFITPPFLLVSTQVREQIDMKVAEWREEGKVGAPYYQPMILLLRCGCWCSDRGHQDGGGCRLKSLDCNPFAGPHGLSFLIEYGPHHTAPSHPT